MRVPRYSTQLILTSSRSSSLANGMSSSNVRRTKGPASRLLRGAGGSWLEASFEASSSSTFLLAMADV